MVLLQRNQIPSEEAVRHRIQQSMLSRSVNAVVSESRNLEFSMTEVRSTNNQHGATPLRVLVAGNPPPTPFLGPEERQDLYAAWLELQRDIATRSSQAELVVVEGSGHFIQRDKPQVVIDTVRDVIELVRSDLLLESDSLER